MQKIGSITTTADVNGEWTNGNVAGGIAPTILDAAWLNTVQRELAGIVTSSGLTLDPANDGQVLAGLKLLMNKALTGVVGAMRNGAMSIQTASATATFTATELIVETAAGIQFRLNSFNKTINLGTIGAGGMDTGTVATSGFVALYAIYNPTTGVSALLASNIALTAQATDIYSGANMPTGFTASALLSVWLISASKFTPGAQIDRHIITNTNLVFSATSVISTTPTALSLSAFIPANAKEVDIFQRLVSASADLQQMALTSTAIILGLFGAILNASTSGQQYGSTGTMVIIEPQVIYYYQTGSVSTTRQLYITGYKI